MSDYNVNAIRFWDQQLFESGSAKTSTTGLFRGTTAEVFYFYSKDENATYYIDVQIGSEWHQVATGAITKATLTVATVNYYMPIVRLRIAASAWPTLVTAYAYGQPAAYIRES